MHPLLKRQLKRAFRDAPVPCAGGLAPLFSTVSQAYRDFDVERGMLEHALAETAKELEERHAALLFDVACRDRAEGERDAFFRTSSDLLCILDERLRFCQLSPGWEHILGREPGLLTGTEATELIHPDDRPKLEVSTRALKSAERRISNFELRMAALDGSWRWISWGVSYDPARHLIFAIGRDTTAERAMAQDLASAQKLEAVGHLASGVAHEINTPVQFIGDNLSFVAESMKDVMGYLAAVDALLTPEQRTRLAEAARKADLDYVREEVPRSLSESKDGVRRVAELVRALKEFAHPDKPEMQPTDLNRAIERSLVLARGELKHIAKVVTHLSPLPPVTCHVGGLSQVILNLVINAAHAIEERAVKEPGPGWERLITVSTETAGGEVCIEVRDTGCGIPDAVKPRIFEPFFTTKPMGKGSGQGLPLVRNVITLTHGGKVEVDSTVGVGTTFRLRLPIGGPGARKVAA